MAILEEAEAMAVRLEERSDFCAAANGDHRKGLHPNVAMRSFDEAAALLRRMIEQMRV